MSHVVVMNARVLGRLHDTYEPVGHFHSGYVFLIKHRGRKESAEYPVMRRFVLSHLLFRGLFYLEHHRPRLRYVQDRAVVVFLRF